MTTPYRSNASVQIPALGDVAKCRITGYQGVVLARTLWLNNCPRLTVQAREVKDGKPVDACSFDEPDLEFVEKSGVDVIPPERPKQPLEIGDIAKDRITGLEGIVVGITTWLNGCSRVNLKPRSLDKDGKPLESSCFDEKDCLLVAAVNPKPEKVTKTGGPRQDPQRW